jgi:hypothetical protein
VTYKVLSEHQTHFEVEHPKEGRFKVAKGHLDQKTIEKIRKMAFGGKVKRYAEGGEVEDNAPSFGDAAPPPEPMTEEPESAPAEIAAPPPPEAEPEAEETAPIADAATPPPEAGTPANDDEALNGDRPPNPNVGGFQTTSAGAVGDSPNKGLEDAYGKSFREMETGIKGKADAEAKAAMEQAEAYRQHVQKVQEATTARDKELSANEAQHKQIYDSILNQKIDPNRVWNNTSTGGKIMASIGILLSGMGSGITGQPNLALKVIDDTITRDVDAQKAELGKKETLLSDNLRKYGNIQTAYTATLSQLHTVTMAQIAESAARSNSGIAKANAQYAIGQLDMKRAELNQSLAAGKMGQVLGSGAFANTSGINLENPMLDPYRDRIVQLPSGGIVLAKRKEETGEVQKTLTSLQTIDKQLDGLVGLMRDNGRTVLGSKANALAASAKDSLVLEMGQLHGVNRLNEQELKKFEDLVPDPGSIMQDKALAKVMQLKKLIAEKRNAEYANHIEGFNPGLQESRSQGAPGLSATPTLTSGKR